MASYSFIEYGTGKPLVFITFKYDTEALTMTKVTRRGRKSERETVSLTEAQVRSLNLLATDSQMAAASIFGEAQGPQIADDWYDSKPDNKPRPGAHAWATGDKPMNTKQTARRLSSRYEPEEDFGDPYREEEQQEAAGDAQ